MEEHGPNVDIDTQRIKKLFMRYRIECLRWFQTHSHRKTHYSNVDSERCLIQQKQFYLPQHQFIRAPFAIASAW